MTRVVYLHGFASSPLSTKARYFSRRFAAEGTPFDVPDLAAGGFERMTLSSQLAVIESACQGGPVILMGSSLGGYLAALFAARHPEVQRVVLMAPAFCFSRRWSEVFGPADGESIPVFHYGQNRVLHLHRGILDDAAQYEDYPGVSQPTLILHGLSDTVVPPGLSQQFAQGRSNVRLRLLASDHELTDVLDEMWAEIRDFLV